MGVAEFRVGLAAAFADRVAPALARGLAAEGRAGRRVLVELTRSAYDLLVAPWRSEIREAVRVDRAARVRQLSVSGVGAVLAGLPGVVGWDGSVLEVTYPEDRVVELRGRGLTLIPAYFCWGSPVTFIDPGLPPVLVYPAAQAGTAATGGTAPGSGLDADRPNSRALPAGIDTHAHHQRIGGVRGYHDRCREQTRDGAARGRSRREHSDRWQRGAQPHRSRRTAARRRDDVGRSRHPRR